MISYQLRRTLFLMVMDIAIVLFAVFMALQLRFEFRVPPGYWVNLESVVVTTILIFILFFALFGLYRTSWRYASIDELMLITWSVSSGVLGAFFYAWLVGLAFPRSVYVILWFLMLFFIGGSRLSLRLIRTFAGRMNGSKSVLDLFKNSRRANGNGCNGAHKMLIYGAGDAGVMVAQELKKHPGDHQVIGYIDDDQTKRGQIVHGYPVLGTRDDLLHLTEGKGVTEVVIAIPSASYRVIKDVVNFCLGAGVKVTTIPGIYEILAGQAQFSKLKEVQIEDLLKRPPVELDIPSIAGYLSGETVMITGCGGSIGSELCRQVMGLKPSRIILFERDENNLFFIHRELRRYNNVELLPVVGDIQNYKRLESIYVKYKPGVVFHAAAYKHVPMMQENVDEAIRNNIFGTRNVADLASAYRVKRFVMVSTDKAVSPSSVMGATKRVAELYIQMLSRASNTLFCAVRFGNVLDSRGSVVPLFREQIATGGPVTVTHPEMVRYFMTIPEAVQLIIQSGAMIEKGEVFVLDMGDPVRIVDLASDMIMLSGLKPYKDIDIRFTGIRPGEKLYEELFTDREAFSATTNERIFIARESSFGEVAFSQELEELRTILGTDFLFMKEKLCSLTELGVSN